MTGISCLSAAQFAQDGLELTLQRTQHVRNLLARFFCAFLVFGQSWPWDLVTSGTWVTNNPVPDRAIVPHALGIDVFVYLKPAGDPQVTTVVLHALGKVEGFPFRETLFQGARGVVLNQGGGTAHVGVLGHFLVRRQGNVHKHANRLAGEDKRDQDRE